MTSIPTRSRVAGVAFLMLLFNALSLGQDPAQDSTQLVTGQSKVDGYRGIWFTLGQFYGPGKDGQDYSSVSSTPTFPYGDKYSGGLGTYTAKHTPLAIYAPAVDRTFFVYGGTTRQDERRLLCMVSYYDHQTGKVPKPSIVYVKHGVDDPHDNPSIQIDDAGYLWVFVSGRGTHRTGLIYRSTEPYSIDRFDQVEMSEFTYPQPHQIVGSPQPVVGPDPLPGVWDGQLLFLFTKYSGVRELYFRRCIAGQWSPTDKIAGIRDNGESRAGHYQTSDSVVIETPSGSRTKVGTFFNRHPNGNVDRRTDLYYLQTVDGGATWQTIEGVTVQLPIQNVSSQTRVANWQVEGQNVYLKNMVFDEQGNPALLFITSAGAQPGPPNGPRFLRVTHWNGSQWSTNTVCSIDHNYDMGSLAISGNRWTVMAPTAPGPQPDHGGGEVTRWVSDDRGVTWSLDRSVTRSSPRNHNYVRTPVGAKDPFVYFWTDGDPTGLSKSKLYFCDRLGKNVFELPYEMSEPMATPLRLE